MFSIISDGITYIICQITWVFKNDRIWGPSMIYFIMKVNSGTIATFQEISEKVYVYVCRWGRGNS